MIYPVDNAIQRLNNPGLKKKKENKPGGLVDNLIIIDEGLLWEIPRKYIKKIDFPHLISRKAAVSISLVLAI